MPYEKSNELPDNVKNVLPEHAQSIYQSAYNNAWQQYKDKSARRGDESQEEVAHKVAWAAVKNEYEKDEDGKWHKKR